MAKAIKTTEILKKAKTSTKTSTTTKSKKPLESVVEKKVAKPKAKAATKKVVETKIIKKTEVKPKVKKTEGSEKLADLVIKGMQEKKALNIVKIDLRNISNAVCDYFVVCHGNSNTQVNAIADSVEYEVIKKIQAKPWHREGFENSEWVLLDYVDVVVHVFQEEFRNFYQLERLWDDAEITKFD